MQERVLQGKFQEAGISPNEIVQPEDLAALPFTTKDELRSFYPLKVKLPPEEEIVRIHSSSRHHRPACAYSIHQAGSGHLD